MDSSLLQDIAWVIPDRVDMGQPRFSSPVEPKPVATIWTRTRLSRVTTIHHGSSHSSLTDHGRHCMGHPSQSHPPPQWTSSTLSIYSSSLRLRPTILLLEKTKTNLFPHLEKTVRILFHLISFLHPDLPTVAKTSRYTLYFHSFPTPVAEKWTYSPLGDLSIPLKNLIYTSVKKYLFLTFFIRSVIFVIFTVYPIFPKMTNSPFFAISTIFAKIPIFLLFTKIPKIPKFGVYPKNGQNWEFLEIGDFGGILENGLFQGIPQNAQNSQNWGFWEIPQKWQFWVRPRKSRQERLM